MKLVTSNRAFRTLRGYPAALCRPGTEIGAFYRYNAERGDYGPGDPPTLAAMPRSSGCAAASRTSSNTSCRRDRSSTSGTRPSRTAAWCSPTPTSPTRKRAEQDVARKEAQLQVALDNMPGALAYTDENLDIVVCNDRFIEMYPVPRELLQPGRPYPEFLRYLAEHGYYGDGDVEALVAQARGKRAQSLRARRSRTAPPTAASTKSIAGGRRRAVR